MNETRSFSGAAPPAERGKGAHVVVALQCAQPLAPARAHRLGPRDALVLGRDPAASDGAERTIAIADPWMSARHARFLRDGGSWMVEDLGSKNGTSVDGQRIDSRRVDDGDVIEVAGTLVVFRLGPAAADAGADERPGLRTLSARLRTELATLGRVARATVPLLILGESGTGKEVVARAVHELSGRRGPFVALNCASLPAALVESELFGARRGAFSGADADRAGLMLAAHQGTLLLDEIAELAPHAQASLLRALQEREVRPLGATTAQKVDVRVIAATHEDLAARVKDGRFRQDLYARLRGYRVTLPPLRERLEDVGLLVSTLLAAIAPERAPALRFARAAGRALFTYAWPMNIRELEHALRAAVAIAPGDEIELAHLPEEIREAAERPPGADDPARFLELARAHHGNVTALARALRTSRSHVRRLARRHGVDLEAEREPEG